MNVNKPQLMAMISRGEGLGSGMRNMMQYGKKYGGADPQLIEGDVFRMILSVPEFGKKAVDGSANEKPSEVTAQGTAQVSEQDDHGTRQVPDKYPTSTFLSCFCRWRLIPGQVTEYGAISQ